MKFLQPPPTSRQDSVRKLSSRPHRPTGPPLTPNHGHAHPNCHFNFKPPNPSLAPRASRLANLSPTPPQRHNPPAPTSPRPSLHATHNQLHTAQQRHGQTLPRRHHTTNGGAESLAYPSPVCRITTYSFCLPLTWQHGTVLFRALDNYQYR